MANTAFQSSGSGPGGSGTLSGSGTVTVQFSDLARIASARRRLIRNVALGTIAVTLIVLMLLPTRYSSTAMVQLDQRRNIVADSTSILSALPTDPASLQNQIQIITSRDVAGQVIDKLHLENDPEFNASANAGSGLSDSLVSVVSWLTGRAFVPADATKSVSQNQRDGMIDHLLRNESVDALGMSTTISIGYTASDPDKAARIANAIADAYIAYQMQQKADITGDTTKWLYDRIAKLSDQVQAAESATQKYKAENNLNETADGTPLTDQQLSAIDTQIVQARSDLAQKQAIYDRVQSLIASGHPADISQVVASPVIVQLRTQQAELQAQESELATRYGAKHPKLIAAEKQRADLDTKISQEVDRIAGSITNDVAVARANLGSLQGSMKSAEHDAAGQNMKRVKLKALEAGATSTRTMYEAFVTRLRETQDAINTSDAHVISKAPVPVSPSFPNRGLIFGASIPAGLLLGLLAALLAERLEWPTEVRPLRPVLRRQPFEPAPAVVAAMPLPQQYAPQPPQPQRTPQPPPQRAPQPQQQRPPQPPADPFRGAPVLADVPDAAPVRAAGYVIDWPGSAFTHSMSALLQRIVGANNGERPRVVAFTSAQSGEGKTTMAVALARLASQAGMRVIVLDGNFARPAVAKMMGLNGVPVGIGEVFAGKRPLSRSMFKDPRSNVMLIASARPVQKSGELAASRKTAQLVEHLRRACDLLIIDTPAVLASPDTRPLLMLSDAVVMVARFNGQPRAAVGHAMDALASMGAPPAGIVLAR